MRPWKIFEVPISRSLKKTKLGTTVVLRKIPLSERKKWKEFTWVQDVERNGERHAVILAEKRRKNGQP